MTCGHADMQAVEPVNPVGLAPWYVSWNPFLGRLPFPSVPLTVHRSAHPWWCRYGFDGLGASMMSGLRNEHTETRRMDSQTSATRLLVCLCIPAFSLFIVIKFRKANKLVGRWEMLGKSPMSRGPPKWSPTAPPSASWSVSSAVSA